MHCPGMGHELHSEDAHTHTGTHATEAPVIAFTDETKDIFLPLLLFIVHSTYEGILSHYMRIYALHTHYLTPVLLFLTPRKQ